jgi:FAD/FMN-containing dehydrogenase
MADLRVITLTGEEAELGEAVVERFGSGLRGGLLRPGDSAYEEARKIWNGLIDKRPALIARCAGVGDVIDSVNFARENDLLVAVRGGGHNVAGNAVCDGGLVIDLSPMRGIRVDPERRTVRAEGGVTLGDLDRETQVFGLATPMEGGLRDGDRRADPQRRHRLAQAQVGPLLRQPPLRRCCDRRR